MRIVEAVSVAISAMRSNKMRSLLIVNFTINPKDVIFAFLTTFSPLLQNYAPFFFSVRVTIV